MTTEQTQGSSNLNSQKSINEETKDVKEERAVDKENNKNSQEEKADEKKQASEVEASQEEVNETKNEDSNVTELKTEKEDKKIFGKDKKKKKEKKVEIDSEELEALKDQVKKLEKEATEAKDKHLRVVAEMDNMRKRSQKERTDLRKYGAEYLMTDLLTVLDSFDKALPSEDTDQKDGDSASFIEGMKLVQKQLLVALEKNGLKAIPSVGQPFDPNLHQGVQRVEEEDIKEDTVKEEYNKGYQLHDRLLRPAMVVVAVPKGE